MRILKRIPVYLKFFWKWIASGFLVICGILGYKFIPFLFIDFTPPPVAVSTEQVQQVTWKRDISAIGTLQAVNTVKIASEVDGRVTAIHFESGNAVKTNDVILQLDDSKEQADLERYKAQLTFSTLSAQRSQKLVKGNFTSQSDFDQKDAARVEDDALVTQAKTAVKKKKILAPFDGILGISLINLGQYVLPGTPIVTLTDPKKLYINFSLPESNQTLVKLGQTVLVEVSSYPGELFEGKVMAIDPQVDVSTRTFKVQGILENDSLRLVSGMSARVKLLLPFVEKVLTVPETAVDFSLYGTFVYRVDPDPKDSSKHIAKRSLVDVGSQKDGRVMITKGLSSTDCVVTTGQLKLVDGTAIAVKDTPPPPMSLTTLY